MPEVHRGLHGVSRPTARFSRRDILVPTRFPEWRMNVVDRPLVPRRDGREQSFVLLGLCFCKAQNCKLKKANCKEQIAASKLQSANRTNRKTLSEQIEVATSSSVAQLAPHSPFASSRLRRRFTRPVFL